MPCCIIISENRWKKRGLALVPTKFGVAFGLSTLNQGAALLNVYTDGSVLLSHGGMEMGQGLDSLRCLLEINSLAVELQGCRRGGGLGPQFMIEQWSSLLIIKHVCWLCWMIGQVLKVLT